MSTVDRDELDRDSLNVAPVRLDRVPRPSSMNRPGMSRALTAQDSRLGPSTGASDYTTRRDDVMSVTPSISLEKRRRPRSILDFLSVKEPSAVALKEFAEQQRRLAAVKGTKSSSVATVSQQRLPATVPKVNSKWDGMPKVAHDKGRDAWKKSSDAGSVVSRRPRHEAPVLSTINSTTHSERPSSDHHRGTSRHSTGSRSSSNKNSTDSTRRPASHTTASDRSVRRPTANESTREEAASAKHTGTSLGSTQPLSSSRPPLPSIQQDHTSSESRRVAEEETSTARAAAEARIHKQMLEAPLLNNDAVATSSSNLSEPRPTLAATGPRQRSAEDVLQWPLSAMPVNVFAQPGSDHDLPQTPPIPRRSTHSGVENFDEVEAESPAVSPVTPIPAFDESIAAFQFDLVPYQKPRITTTYNRPFSPTRTFSPQGRSNLRSPSSQPGRPITKETELPTIPESDAASIVTDAAAPDELEPASQVETSTPPRMPAPYDARDSLTESRASSDMSSVLYQSPKERLQLGGFIKHQRKEAPWPVMEEEDKAYVLDENHISPKRGDDNSKDSGSAWKRTNGKKTYKR